MICSISIFNPDTTYKFQTRFTHNSYLKRGMKKTPQQIFQAIIGACIKKVRDHYSANNLKQQLDTLNEALKNDKNIKELDANRYMYLLEEMHTVPSLAQDSFSAIEALLNQGFMVPHKSPDVLHRLVRILNSSVESMPESVASILIKLQAPQLEVIELMFRVQSICLYENTSTRVKSHLLTLLAQLFGFYRKSNSVFTNKLYRFLTASLKTIPQQFQLISSQEQQQLLEHYVNRIVREIVDKVELSFETESPRSPQNGKGESQNNQISPTQIRRLQSGKFGICFMCRSPADYYCKDTKISVCGVECKRNHLVEVRRIESSSSLFHSRFSEQKRRRVAEFLLAKANLLSDSTNRADKILSIYYLVEILMSSDFELPNCIVFAESETGNTLKISLLFLYLWHLRKNELVDHLFSELYIHDSIGQARSVLTHYWLELFSDEHLFTVFWNFDLAVSRPNVVKDVLSVTNKRDKDIAFDMVQRIVGSVFSRQANSGFMSDPKYEFLQQNRLLVDAVNSNAAKGWEKLKAHFASSSEPSAFSTLDIALFLRKNQRSISRDRLGEIFAVNKSQHHQVLEHFMKSLHLETLEVDEALREIFFHFSVSESQQIFRVIEAFIKLYNHERFRAHKDQLFEFAYFIMMLQTELHNSAIQKPMTFQDMIIRVSGFNKELAKDTEYLGRIYTNIKNKPFSHQNRRVLYEMQESIAMLQPSKYNKTLVVYNNWSFIYSVTASATHPDIVSQIEYRAALLLMEHESSQMFLHLLLKQLSAVEILTTPLIEQQIFLISSVFNLIWHQPNYVDSHWKTIFALLRQYYTLSERLKDINNPYFPMIVSNKESLKMCLTEAHIGRLYHTTTKLTPLQLVQFCKNLITPYSLEYLPNIFTMNYERCGHEIWSEVHACVLRDPRYINRLHTYSVLIVFMNEQAIKPMLNNNVQKLPNEEKGARLIEYLKDIMGALRWQAPVEEDAFIQTITCLISNEESPSRSSHFLHPELWILILQHFHSLSKSNKLEICDFLKTHSAEFNSPQHDPYSRFVLEQVELTGNEHLRDIIQSNLDLIKQRPDLFLKLLDDLPKQILRYFISKNYIPYIVDNLSLFPVSSELFQLFRTHVAELSPLQLQKINLFLKSLSKNPDSQCINLLITLLCQPAIPAEETIQTLVQFLDSCNIVFPHHTVKLPHLGKQPHRLAPQELIKFGINYPLLIKKSVTQLTIFNGLLNIHSQLDNRKLEFLLPIINEAVISSKEFNRNIGLRYLLWKDGLIKDLKQLPGLLKKERVCQSLRMSILSFLSANSTEKSKQFVEQVLFFLQDLCAQQAILLEYGQTFREMTASSSLGLKDDLNYHYLNEIDREISDYRKLAHKLIQDLQSVCKDKIEQLEKSQKIAIVDNVTRVITYGILRNPKEQAYTICTADLDAQKLISGVLKTL